MVASFVKANYAGSAIVDGMCHTRHQPVGASIRSHALQRIAFECRIALRRVLPFVVVGSLDIWSLSSSSPALSTAAAIGRLKPSDLQHAARAESRESVVAADNLMADARKLIKQLDISYEEGFRHVTRMDVRLALFLVRKAPEGEDRCKSVSEIAQALLGI